MNTLEITYKDKYVSKTKKFTNTSNNIIANGRQRSSWERDLGALEHLEEKLRNQIENYCKLITVLYSKKILDDTDIKKLLEDSLDYNNEIVKIEIK